MIDNKSAITDESPDHTDVDNDTSIDRDTVGSLPRHPNLVVIRMTSSPSSSLAAHQTISSRRLSDPGCRLSVHPLRDELRRLAALDNISDTPSVGGGRFTSINRLPDPRLDIIRSLSPSAACDAAGEEGEALNPPLIYRSSRRQSASPQVVIHPRCEARCISLPVPEEISHLTSGTTGGLATEKGEAIGAIARLGTGDSEDVVTVRHPTLEMISFRRRSVSLEGYRSSHLDVIIEEKGMKHKLGRNLSLSVDKS